MKRRYIIAIAIIAMHVISCEPEPYTGQLDSPVGNWEGVSSEYFFNGEMVAALDSCEITAISFYKQGICCIEGVKGAFPFIYNDSESLLQIDSTLWEVNRLTGVEMVLSYLYRIMPLTKTGEDTAEPVVKPDANGFILPIEYKGMSINSDRFGYFYINEAEATVYCNFKGWKNEDKTWTVDFWYDTHTDVFIPLKVETGKK